MVSNGMLTALPFCACAGAAISAANAANRKARWSCMDMWVGDAADRPLILEGLPRGFNQRLPWTPEPRHMFTVQAAGGAGMSREQWEADDAFDLVFVDADKASIPEYFEWSLKLTAPGSVIIVDNVIRDGAIIDLESTDPNIIGIRRFNEMVAAESRVSATAIQTVGLKGYDGFAFLLVG